MRDSVTVHRWGVNVVKVMMMMTGGVGVFDGCLVVLFILLFVPLSQK